MNKIHTVIYGMLLDRKRRYMTLLAFVLLFAICGCSMPAKQEPRRTEKNDIRFNALMQLNDLNERAFSYHQFCLSKTEPMNEKFLENFKTSSNLLFDECLESLHWEPQYIVSQVLKRREQIQGALKNHYLTKGCQSPEASVAQKHYRTFSQLNERQIKEY